MRRAMFCAGVIILATTAFAQAPTEIPQPNPSIGNEWTYKSSQGTATVRLTKIEKNATGQSTFIISVVGHEEKYTGQWNLIEVSGPDKVSYSPPYCSMPPAPWTVGKQWSCTSNVTVNGKCCKKFSAAGRIEKEEQITVPAGTFQTIRVSGTVSGSVIRPMASGGGTCWYAPAVNRVVKCTVSDPKYSFEMVSHKK